MDPKLIAHWFSNHPATPDQRAAYERLWEEARSLAATFNEVIPNGADKTAAVRQLRNAITAAITAIACHIEPERPSDIVPPGSTGTQVK